MNAGARGRAEHFVIDMDCVDLLDVDDLGLPDDLLLDDLGEF